jgi:hypothetical protein
MTQFGITDVHTEVVAKLPFTSNTGSNEVRYRPVTDGNFSIHLSRSYEYMMMIREIKILKNQIDMLRVDLEAIKSGALIVSTIRTDQVDRNLTTV